MSEGVIGGIHDDATYAVLDAAWDSWGRRDIDVIAHLINPAFLGGPRWPALRQAHTIARRENALLVASSGLADPTAWDDAAPTNGYELEVYGITPDLPLDSDAMSIAHSWFGQTVMTVSNLVAQYGFEVPDMVDRHGVITIELAEADLPAEAADTYLEDGAAVVMLGLTAAELPASVQGPLSPIRLLNVKLLTAAEGRFCVDNSMGDDNARRELARRFTEQGHPLWSSLTRPSVV
ncbi:hypothetical protein [Nocardia huaxiensis]|uniref:Suppressor of fused protein SUFU n=1 Tax=Nocardia huaxiensis TaxID=2755382 RepID=A0A7D6ZDI0_9NOCA|nr:hypothetical protein [Nocardia huaxiensis]QLY31138.1 hypothetical protein H0264_01710 [Nocardia huaxiensis]UFS94667.1 hypothetical protein LPY97_28555 [Nocardia huaxiensis]